MSQFGDFSLMGTSLSNKLSRLWSLKRSKPISTFELGFKSGLLIKKLNISFKNLLGTNYKLTPFILKGVLIVNELVLLNITLLTLLFIF